MFRLVFFLMLISSWSLLAQNPTVSNLQQDSFNVGSGGSKVGQTGFSSSELASSEEVNLLSKIAEVFGKVIKRCSKKRNKKSKNSYVLINKLTERGFYDLDLLIKKRINQKNDYFDFSEEVNVRRGSLGNIIREIKNKNYFNERLAVELAGLEDATSAPIPTRYNSATYIYLLKDFKVPLKKASFIYNIRLTVIDPRTSKVLCNVVKRIDVTEKNKVKHENQVKPEVIEKTNYIEKPKYDNFISIMPYFTGNPLAWRYIKVFNFYSKDYVTNSILGFGGMLQYDRKMKDSFYLGLEFSLGYLYYNFSDDEIFQKGIKQLLLSIGLKPSFMLTLSEEYSIDLLVGGKIAYFNILGTYNFLIGAFVGLRMDYFKVEFAFPFPYVKMGITIPF